MITFVVHIAGVNVKFKVLFPKFVQLDHQFVEYSTDTTGDGVAVLFIVHVVDHE
jgi:hypothetical protein